MREANQRPSEGLRVLGECCAGAWERSGWKTV